MHLQKIDLFIIIYIFTHIAQLCQEYYNNMEQKSDVYMIMHAWDLICW